MALRRQWARMSGQQQSMVQLRPLTSPEDEEEQEEAAAAAAAAAAAVGMRAKAASYGHQHEEDEPAASGGAERGGGGGGGRGEREGERGLHHRRRPDAPTKDIKQRLTKVLVPVLHPATRDWTFNTRVTGLNLANASVGSVPFTHPKGSQP